MAAATKTERGTNVRLAIALASCVCIAAADVLWEKKFQKRNPVMK